MDFSIILSLIGLIGPISSLISTGISVNSIGETIKDPAVQAVFKTVGAKLFPNAAPDMQIAGAVVSTYSPAYNMKVQNLLNSYLKLSPPLEVDGSYGPKTREAAKTAQKKLGVVEDGWAGDVTLAAIQAALTTK